MGYESIGVLWAALEAKAVSKIHSIIASDIWPYLSDAFGVKVCDKLKQIWGVRAVESCGCT